MSAGTVGINQGTQTGVPVDALGGTSYPLMKLDRGLYGVSSYNAPFGTTITSGTSTLGTIKAKVVGSAIFVTDLIVSAGSATSLVIGMGGTSTPFIGTLSLNANGGVAMPFNTPGSVTSGSDLVYQQSANGPLSITVNGFVG